MVVTRPWRLTQRRLARVHEQEAARAVGILGLAGLEAALAEQRGLLVARRARDGNFAAPWMLAVSPNRRCSGGTSGQHAARDAQDAAGASSSQSRRWMSKSIVREAFVHVRGVDAAAR